MNISEITQEQYERYKVDKDDSYLNVFASEKKWFINSDENLLGIILEDKIDKDWAYLVLAKESDGFFRAIDVETSIDSSEKSESGLVTTLHALSEAGKKEETLFKADEQVIGETSNLFIKDIDDEIKRYFNKYPEKLYELSPRKFEELVASILTDFGFQVELTKATRDGGRDIIASIRTKVSNYLTYVECKRYNPDNKVGVGIIREVIGVHNIHKPSKSIIVTTSFFSQDAITEAKTFENQLELKDFDEVKKWLQHY